MSVDLDSLYQEIILDHYRNPHHAGLRDPFESEVHHVNPTCGDEITLRVHLEGAPGSALSPIWVWAGLSLLVSFVAVGKWVEAFADAMQQYSPRGY